MSKWVEVEVTMFRRFMVEVPEGVDSPEQWAEVEVLECALTDKERLSVTDTEYSLIKDYSYFDLQKEYCEIINLVK